MNLLIAFVSTSHGTWQNYRWKQNPLGTREDKPVTHPTNFHSRHPIAYPDQIPKALIITIFTQSLIVNQIVKQINHSSNYQRFFMTSSKQLRVLPLRQSVRAPAPACTRLFGNRSVWFELLLMLHRFNLYRFATHVQFAVLCLCARLFIVIWFIVEMWTVPKGWNCCVLVCAGLFSRAKSRCD